MSDYRRDGIHQNAFAREIRGDKHGGTIPEEWGCRVIDLDAVYLHLDGEPYLALTEGEIWVWYRPEAEPCAIAELKRAREPQVSWAVTQYLAKQAKIPGFKIVRHDDGTLAVTDLSHSVSSYSCTREFVELRIAPLVREQAAA